MTEYSDSTGYYRVHLPEAITVQLQGYCRQSDKHETGGIVIGYYSVDLHTAHVTRVTAPPSDSKAGRNWFRRGLAGLQSLCDGLWHYSLRQYYLGEWHYHPGGSPMPSAEDSDQLLKIAKDPGLKCPEPILIILGGLNSATEVSIHLAVLGHLVRLDKKRDDDANYRN